MAVALFTDFGAADLYVGQVKAVLAARAPRTPVIDALHSAVPYRIEPAAHLLAALADAYPRGTVFMAVVDPGVGGERGAIVVGADGRTFVGPDNGLLSVVWARASRRGCRRIAWRPTRLSASFHGRDLFAPVVAAIAARRVPPGWLRRAAAPAVRLDPGDLAAAIYVDHYGNVLSGLRARSAPRNATLRAGRRRIDHARVFSDARHGAPFWYENSLGLVEIAVREGHAADALGLRVGSRIAWHA